MPEPPTPALLSAERLAELSAQLEKVKTSPPGTSRHTYGLAPKLAAAVPALLAHVEAQQALFDARDKALCEAFDDFRQQVATELRGLLRREPRKEDLLNSDELLALAFEQRREYNATIRAVAARLHLDLTTPAP